MPAYALYRYRNCLIYWVKFSQFTMLLFLTTEQTLYNIDCNWPKFFRQHTVTAILSYSQKCLANIYSNRLRFGHISLTVIISSHQHISVTVIKSWVRSVNQIKFIINAILIYFRLKYIRIALKMKKLWLDRCTHNNNRDDGGSCWCAEQRTFC